jgi:hypothetical protein
MGCKVVGGLCGSGNSPESSGLCARFGAKVRPFFIGDAAAAVTAAPEAAAPV